MDNAKLREIFEAGWPGRNERAQHDPERYAHPVVDIEWNGFLACARALEPMVRDGERYRWLRLNSGYSIRCNLFGETPMYEHKDSDLDAAIDAAMSAALEDGNATE